MSFDDKTKKNTDPKSKENNHSGSMNNPPSEPINTNMTVNDVGEGVIFGTLASAPPAALLAAPAVLLEVSGATGAVATVVGGASAGLATAGFVIGVPVAIITAPSAVRNERIYRGIEQSFQASQKFIGIKAMSVTERKRLKELKAVEDAEGIPDLYHPANTDKLEQVIRERKARYEEVMKKHDSWIPRFIRSGEGAARYNEAWIETLSCDAALEEFPAFKVMVDTVYEDRMKHAEQKADKLPQPKEIAPKEISYGEEQLSLPAIFNSMKNLPSLAAA